MHSKNGTFIPSRVSGRGYKIGPFCVSVYLCDCQLVNALTAELFDVGTRNLLWGLNLAISQTNSMVKIIGQGSKVAKLKNVIFEV